MNISFKNLLMGTLAAAAMASCASDKGALTVPQAPLEECVYKGDKTEFSVWAPGAEAAQVSLYHSAMDKEPFLTLDGLRILHEKNSK